jgi:hypothetical protein
VSDSGSRSAGDPARGSYFYLSYAQSPPLAGRTQADPDQWVRAFYRDLMAAVARYASPGAGLALGFFDQEIPLGADWNVSLTRALGAAQVFVPLYSPGYFARSWPGREWACFYQRLVNAQVENPLQRFAPVLWIPLPADTDPPGLAESMALAGVVDGYPDNGLRALLRLQLYRESYQLIVERLAARIVELAEGAPLRSSAVPNIDQVTSTFNAEATSAVFAINVAAPTLSALPTGCDPAGYGDSSVSWRPYPRTQ